MALSNAYITVEDLTQHLSSMGSATGENNDLLERVINASSRGIDQYCRRRFYTDTSTSTLSFMAEDPWTVFTADISTATGVVVKTDTTDDGTFDTTWDSGDWELRPLNQVASNGEAWPYTSVHAVEARTFPTVGRRAARVQIEATWGWPSTPPGVEEACLLLAAKVYRRRHSPEGVVGFGEFGPVRISRRQDPDIMMLLDPYCQVGVFR